MCFVGQKIITSGRDPKYLKNGILKKRAKSLNQTWHHVMHALFMLK